MIAPCAPTAPAYQGVPSYFVGCCYEAAAGGDCGYSHPGWHLAIHLREEVPYGADDDDWLEIVDQLVEMALQQPGPKRAKLIVGWFCRYFTKCMALIPRRRRDAFVAGVVQAIEDGRLDQ